MFKYFNRKRKWANNQPYTSGTTEWNSFTVNKSQSAGLSVRSVWLNWQMRVCLYTTSTTVNRSSLHARRGGSAQRQQSLAHSSQPVTYCWTFSEVPYEIWAVKMNMVTQPIKWQNIHQTGLLVRIFFSNFVTKQTPWTYFSLSSFLSLSFAPVLCLEVHCLKWQVVFPQIKTPQKNQIRTFTTYIIERNTYLPNHFRKSINIQNL